MILLTFPHVLWFFYNISPWGTFKFLFQKLYLVILEFSVVTFKFLYFHRDCPLPAWGHFHHIFYLILYSLWDSRNIFLVALQFLFAEFDSRPTQSISSVYFFPWMWVMFPQLLHVSQFLLKSWHFW
jgi:hypothetical protein